MIDPAVIKRRSPVWAFAVGSAVGILGGLVGLGGAEFRLPVLIGVFGFAALYAVILNKAMSLVVVVAAIPARLFAVPLADVADHWTIVVNLLVGSLAGAWVGASWATRMRTATLYRMIAVLLVGIAVVFAASDAGALPEPSLSGVGLFLVGVLAGFGIGVVAAVMGVAGGELLIPTITVLYAVDAKLAGSLSLLVSCRQCWSHSFGTAATRRSACCANTRASSSGWRRARSRERSSGDFCSASCRAGSSCRSSCSCFSRVPRKSGSTPTSSATRASRIPTEVSTDRSLVRVKRMGRSFILSPVCGK